MSSGLALAVACLLALSALISFIAFTAERSGSRAFAVWLLAWTEVLFSAGIMLVAVEDPLVRPIAYYFFSLVAPLMVIGAYLHAERHPPGWLPALAVITGSARVLLFEYSGPELPAIVAASVEPSLAILGAKILFERDEARSPGGAASERFLPIGFLLYGAAELIDAAFELSGRPLWMTWTAWLALGAPLFAVQVVLSMTHLTRRLRTSEERAALQDLRLRVLGESNDAFVVEYDEHGTITYVSPAAERLFGPSRQAIVGRSVLEFVDDAQDSPIKRALASMEHVTESDVTRHSDRPVRTKLADGSIHWLEATRSTYRMEDGTLRIVSLMRDVTERIEREHALRESERRLNRGEEIGRFGSWEYRFESGELFWSAQLARMHGLTPLAGPVDFAELTRLIDRDDLLRLRREIRHLHEGMAFPQIDYRIRRADDGELRHLEIAGEVEVGPDGEAERIVGAIRDITEREILEAALRRGRQHLDLLVESNIVGVFYIDRHRFIRSANDAFLSPLGYSRADLPLDLHRIQSRESRVPQARAIRRLLREGVVLPFETEFVARSGTKIAMLVGSAQLDDEQAIVIALDLSARKRAEAYVARQQRRLEETIADRTQELLQSRSRLIEAERLASVGTLAAGVAHQINNPIGAILNSAEFALRCAEDDDASETFRRALETNLVESRRCAQIVKSMLQFSRDEPPEKWVDDVAPLVRRAHRAINAYAQDREAHVEFEGPDEPLYALICPIEIEQAIVNLLRNAIESRPHGAHVTLTLARRDKSALIEVIDDGRGIDDDDRDRLFEPFYSTRTREGGTGLGLSVAHGIVGDHGGEIQIESLATAGTRVVVSLPLVERSAYMDGRNMDGRGEFDPKRERAQNQSRDARASQRGDSA